MCRWAKACRRLSILAVIMILFSVLILIVNQRTTSEQSYDRCGKSGQISLVNLGKARTLRDRGYLLRNTFFTGILPVIICSPSSIPPNPG